ncbi:NOC3p-domain-containing protein [Neoconidiobolus thromboides FSU 785]|nr:NOC3p-domain-containing protein [Neoconidiobolus thromboides FSU 785]
MEDNIEEEDETTKLEKEHIELTKNKRKDDKDIKSEKQSLKLPIKDVKGKLIRAKDVVESESESDSEDKEEEEEVFSGSELEFEDENENNGNNENEIVDINSKEYVTEKLEQMATMAQDIMSSPEDNYPRLKELKLFCFDKNLMVRKYGYLTLLSLFKDILPSYRIRPLTEAERKMKVSKEVKKQRIYEESLVSSYQSYIKTLINQYKVQNDEKYEGFKTIVIKCLTELMVSKAGFNFEDDIIQFIARKMSTTNEDMDLDRCIEYSVRLFKEDEIGYSSLKLVQSLTKSIKHKEYKIAAKVLRIFIHLKLSDNLIKKDSDNKNKKDKDNKNKRKIVVDKKLLDERKEHLSKKRKKRMKAQKEIEREMQEAEAEYTVEEKDKVQSELLKSIFIIYFRVLKEAPSTRLFPVTLEGLSKFGHLISVDFFSDLLLVLKKILKEGLNSSSNNKSDIVDPIVHSSVEVIRCQLLCILTAFKLLSGQGQALNLDLKDFYTYMYDLILKVAYLPSCENNLEIENDKNNSQKKDQFIAPSIYHLVIDCLDALFFRRERVSLLRAASFLKRLSTLCFYYPQPTAAKLMGMCKAFLIKYPGLDRMLSSEEVAGEGSFQPFAVDPDAANPFSTHLFDLPALFNTYYDPKLKSAALETIRATQIRK